MLTKDEWMEEVKAVLASEYHHRHPFQIQLQNGRLSKAQVQAWALNRYYYQSQIPIKDSVILSKLSDPAMRRAWRQRLVHHDGEDGHAGGVENWLHLTRALGFPDEYVISGLGVLPATRFAVDAYVQFCREKSPLEAIASSLTEIGARTLIQERLSGMLEHYAFINKNDLAYFTHRLGQNDGKASFVMQYLTDTVTTPEQVTKVLDSVTFKCQVLWAQLDTLYYAYVSPGYLPIGAFDPIVQLGQTYQLADGVLLEKEQQRIQAPEKSFLLNPTAFQFIDALQEQKPLECLIAQLTADHPHQSAQIQHDLLKLCRDLLEKGIICPCQ
jgi:coenzyme PQQ biosynthesis protein C